MKKIQSDTIKKRIVSKLAGAGVIIKPRSQAASKINSISRVLTKGTNAVIDGTNKLGKAADAGIKKVQKVSVEIQLAAVEKFRKDNPAADFIPYSRAKWTAEVKAKKTKLDYWDWVVQQIKA